LQAWLAAEKIPGDCDVEISKTFDVCMTDEFLEYAHTSYEEYKADGGNVAGIRILNKEEARKVSSAGDGTVCGGSDPYHSTRSAVFLMHSAPLSGRRAQHTRQRSHTVSSGDVSRWA
jgi:hypothetical protein